MDVGKGIRVIAVSRNLGGGVLVFGPDGSNTAIQTTGEITWLQLFDIDEDGVTEITTEEVDVRGTGVFSKSFHLYRVSSGAVEALWRAESYRSEAPSADRVREVKAFIRFDGSGGGRKARLTHVVLDGESRAREETYVWNNGTLVPSQDTENDRKEKSR